ncbi:hypothetical protein BCR34DRAFT_621829 [Clohesyomyces aquaticus]|uniref:Maintenance of mitochondrial morphology protein 1 n=1 Tax=Clohesyomyces aquaticus TaxID=1231657 RepID=A0A1Y2A582_9PLEO|nr:hypothetical protein BCR34DRAFT_621829 [Clohesyomyces aquaticus]
MAQSTPVPPPSASQSSSLSFTQGFLLGQVSIALLIIFFIKFFIFGEPPSADDRALHLSSLRRARTLAHQTSLHHRTSSTTSSHHPLRHKQSRSIIRSAVNSGGPSIATILAKTYYNVKGHQPESLDWFNVLVAQTIAQLRTDARQDDAVLTSLTELLNSGGKPDWIGEIRVTEIALGDEFPIFSNCRVMPAEDGFGSAGGSGGGLNVGGGGSEEGRLQARMDVDLSDVITLGVETTLVLNYPKPFVAVLPVALAVSVVRFSGTLAVSFIPSSSPPSTSAHPQGHPQSGDYTRRTSSNARRPSSSSGATPSRPTTLAFTFLDDYRLDLSVRSLVGSRSRLQDVPKIAQLIETRVHAWFDERVVEPRFQQIILPSLWPRKQNTRGGDDEDGEGDDADEEAILEDDDVLLPEREGPRTPDRSTRPSSFNPGTLEARIEAEGAKLREAEIRSGVRDRRIGDSAEPGMRFRGDREQRGPQHRPTQSRQTSGFASGDWSGQRGMPGAMPGG